MKMIPFGNTGLTVSAVSFGAIPIQRISVEESTKILRKAYDSGINLYDTARGYSDSEMKIGTALGDVRKNIVIASKTHANTGDELQRDLDLSLKNLNTDYIDLYQFHNPNFVPRPGDENGLYDAALKAKKEGKIRHICISSHRLNLANEMVDSGLFESLQFPLSCISNDEDFILEQRCSDAGMGFLAMKAMAGGLITNSKAAFAYLYEKTNAIPIWGIQHEWELDEFLAYEKNPPVLDSALLEEIAQIKAELSGSFCRGCGYCLPCPAEVPIPMAARLSFMIERSRYERYLEDSWAKQMERINNCAGCGHCLANCPYQLDVPELLKKQLQYYVDFRKSHI